MGALENRSPRMGIVHPRSTNAGANLFRVTQRLLDAASRSCARSRVMIEESRTALERHRAVVASLRASAFTGPTDGAHANGAWRPALGLDDEFVVGPLRLLPMRRAIRGDAATVLLTPAEWQLLAALVRNRSSVLTRSELACSAWGPGFAHRHGEVEVYVSRLRRKLDRAGSAARIQTVRGRGYRLSVDDGMGADTVPPARLGGGAARQDGRAERRAG